MCFSVQVFIRRNDRTLRRGIIKVLSNEEKAAQRRRRERIRDREILDETVEVVTRPIVGGTDITLSSRRAERLYAKGWKEAWKEYGRAAPSKWNHRPYRSWKGRRETQYH